MLSYRTRVELSQSRETDNRPHETVRSILDDREAEVEALRAEVHRLRARLVPYLKRAATVALLVLALAVPAQAKTTLDYTYAEMSPDSVGETWHKALIVGVFMAAPMACPQTVTPSIIGAHMHSRIVLGISNPSDPFLLVFYSAAKDAGCTSLPRKESF